MLVADTAVAQMAEDAKITNKAAAGTRLAVKQLVESEDLQVATDIGSNKVEGNIIGPRFANWLSPICFGPCFLGLIYFLKK